MEPEIYNKTLVTYSYQVSTEPLSDELIERISPLRGGSRRRNRSAYTPQSGWRCRTAGGFPG
jgi:hypothetical protein